MMTAEQNTRLQRMTGLGKTISFKDKRGTGRIVMGKIEDEVSHMVNDYNHVIQKIRLPDGLSSDGSIYAYRTGYWTYDGSWRRIVWGQYTQFLGEIDYRTLLRKARDKGWEIF